MADEPKPPSPPPPGNEQKPGADKQSGAVQPTPPAEKGAPPTPPAKAATPAAPAKPPGATPAPWDSPMVAKLKRVYGSGVEPLTYLGQNYIIADRSLIPELLQILRDEEAFDYCVDLTAVHYPNREKQFDLVWVLYSFARNERMRVKTMIADGEAVPSATPIWPTTNWLEREAYDMFGIKFEGHPDMKRILLPDGWKGHPLRKDYGIIEQDKEWVQINLGIESGQ